MQVITNPNDALRKVSVDVTVFDDLLKLFVEQVTEQMYIEKGVGIAAPQVGVHRRIIVIDPSSGEDASQLTVMVNPQITSATGKAVSNEGCLSVPGVRGDVERFAEVTVEFVTPTGEPKTLTATGLRSIVIQHEVDHLDGVLFIDRVKGIRRLTMRKTG